MATDLKKNFESILLESIRLRLEADVPVGIFLSSGIDSAVVAKLAKAASTKPVHTFTVVFDARPDEGRGAADVARELGTVHHEALLRSDDIAERVVGALAFQDQPSVDGINTFFVSAAVRATGLKVALSGLGGDELFAGYESFRDIPRLLAIGRKLPHLSQEAREKIERAFFPHLSSGRARKLLDLALVMDRPSAIYRASRALFSPPQVERLLGLRPLDSSEIDRAVDDGVRGGSIDAVNGYGLLELRYYTRNTLLRDTDVMSMAHGLEVREPLLDHELVEVAFGIDGYRKLSRRPNKRLLVDAAGGIPHAVSQRRKRGFELPFEPWMRGPLREWVDNRIESARPPLHLEAVRAVYRDFQDQRMSWSRVFALVALVDWCERHQVT